MKFRLRKKASGADDKDAVFTGLSNEAVSMFSALLVKIVGESVKGKMLRMGLVGVISAFTFYVQEPAAPEPLMQAPPPVTAPAVAP